MSNPKVSYEAVAAYVAERDKALTNLDASWVMAKDSRMSPEAALIAMHKMRYECTGVAADLRHASRQWLEQHRYGRLGSLPWPTDGTLPEWLVNPGAT